MDRDQPNGGKGSLEPLLVAGRLYLPTRPVDQPGNGYRSSPEATPGRWQALSTHQASVCRRVYGPWPLAGRYSPPLPAMQVSTSIAGRFKGFGGSNLHLTITQLSPNLEEVWPEFLKELDQPVDPAKAQ
ncbi:hypothetical protein PCASD_17246 [Puccinia coronata f. sp. avenae]|uniref:Uncharacterized protein n=1 Tax=Puccinia coronata f. sp. avenae TaxID=200324 RepID=A0A2N5T9S0_9BASI|nr:hypothetical protein PCASD_17246 [Puccinia coronata f. sp. avenae]